MTPLNATLPYLEGNGCFITKDIRMLTKSPAEHERRILLAVTGLSPQILTETVYALAVRQTPAFVPTEVHIITTRDGAERAQLSLLSEDLRWFHRLRDDYALPPIAFDASRIHVMHTPDGAPLDDIRSPEHNRLAADFITEQVRRLTADPEAALHVSIAGGRKTMGFFLGYALSLYGRPQDRLSHVLVSEPFESSWQFFYPTPKSSVIETRDKKLVDASTAEVVLADIPFVSLRHGLPESLIDGETSYSATVAAARRALGPAELVIDLEHEQIRAAGIRISIPASELALLSLFARRTLDGLPPVNAPMKDFPDLDWARDYLAELHRIGDSMRDHDRTGDSVSGGMTGDDFSRKLSRLKSRLKSALGPAAGAYLVSDGATRPRRYRLDLPPEAIRYGRVD